MLIKFNFDGVLFCFCRQPDGVPGRDLVLEQDGVLL